MINVLRKIIPPFMLAWYHMAMPFLGALIYFFPSKKIKVIGVTGTNGKTTTVNMISEILEKAGYKTAFLSSIKFQIGKEEHPNLLKMTMPGRMVIQKFLRQAVRKKCDYVVLEVSSEGIKQFRHSFINFDRVIFTNLSPEHIESHKGFENYKKAKGKLFQATDNVHIVNTDDENSGYFLKFTSKKKFCYGLKDFTPSDETTKFIQATEVKSSKNGISFKINNVCFNLNLLGRFNVYNALSAVSTGVSCGVDLETCRKALSEFKTVPGRMEEVVSSPFRVIVDYAVTPDAIEKLYQTLREMFSPKKMIAVLGSCGGGRDKWKRPLMGKIAGQYCDSVIITNEDPYDEDPMEIINSISEGIKKNTVKIIEIDRGRAIKKAMELAGEGDVIVITGKGCEPWMCVAGGRKILWDDRRIVREKKEELGIK